MYNAVMKYFIGIILWLKETCRKLKPFHSYLILLTFADC